jgi:hypothetical protein
MFSDDSFLQISVRSWICAIQRSAQDCYRSPARFDRRIVSGSINSFGQTTHNHSTSLNQGMADFSRPLYSKRRRLPRTNDRNSWINVKNTCVAGNKKFAWGIAILDFIQRPQQFGWCEFANHNAFINDKKQAFTVNNDSELKAIENLSQPTGQIPHEQ